MKKRKEFRILLLIVFIICFFVGCNSEQSGEKNQRPFQNETEESETVKSEAEESESAENETSEIAADVESEKIHIGEDLVISDVKSYAGIYFEDGSDEIVDNVLMIAVENVGEMPIQLADLAVYDENGNVYTFRLTTLLPGNKMTVLEQNRAEYVEGMRIEWAEVTQLAVFDKEPEMHEELLEFHCEDYLIRVKNVSGDEFAGGRVCYKNTFGELYIGGITYTVTIPALEPGEEVSLPARHYLENASQLVFVNYV